MNKLLIVFLLILIPYPESDWDLKKEKSGIEIYTRRVEGSSFEEFKAVTSIPNTSMSDVLNIILDVDNYENLFPDCVNPKVLKQEGKWYDIHYIQTKGPFTVKDRDSVFEQKTEINDNGKLARITLNPLPDYFPENKNMIRIRKGTGFWVLEEDNSNNVKVTYQFHGEPGGEIPAWIANSFVVSHPLKTLENLKKIIKAQNQTNKY